jgi:shikimate kinase
MPKNVILIGFMGSGKSTLARILSEQLGWPIVSTDACIEEKEGRCIADIFKDSGEAYFRNLENQVILEVANHQGGIVDCGGGVVLNPKNIAILKKAGTLVHLSCHAEEILRRVKMQPKRPLLDVPDPLAKIRELLKERKPFYEHADMTMDTSDGDLHRVAREVIKKIKHD